MHVRSRALGLFLAIVLAPAAAAEERSGTPLAVSPVADRVWRIAEGDGTPPPVSVVVTHGHPDHAGGASQFAEVHAHPADANPVLGRQRQPSGCGTSR